MVNIPLPPEPPPCRTFKETFWSGLIETEESKQKTKEWTKRMECTHTVIVNGHWEDNPFYDYREDDIEFSSDWVDGYEKDTTVDVDIHHYKCTQCGEIFRY